MFLDVLQSPGPSAVDRFQSPITNTPVKKQLFPSTHLSKYRISCAIAIVYIYVNCSGNRQGWL